jgi:hypothetical protein
MNAMARSSLASVTVMPRTQVSRRARPDGRIARMMRKPNRTTLTAAAALML